MLVTKLEAATKDKYKVFIDEQFAFMLYKGELSRFQMKEGEEISNQVLMRIHEILIKRAKMRAMYLLNIMARTEEQLRQKLIQNGYPKEIVEIAIAYVKSFGYINDEAYIRNFIECRCGKKSRREIEALLAQKELNGSLAERILEEIYEEQSDLHAIQEIARKKRWNPEEADEKEKQKMYAYLMRKGFRYNDIRQILQISTNEY